MAKEVRAFADGKWMYDTETGQKLYKIEDTDWSSGGSGSSGSSGGSTDDDDDYSGSGNYSGTYAYTHSGEYVWISGYPTYLYSSWITADNTLVSGSGNSSVKVYHTSDDGYYNIPPEGYGNNVSIYAGAGNDTIDIGLSGENPLVYLDSSNNCVFGGTGTIISGSGNNTIEYGALVVAGSGNNSIHSNSGTIIGGSGKNTLTGNYIIGGDGDELMDNSYMDSTIFGGSGNNTIKGGILIVTGDGNNFVDSGSATIFGGSGNDTIKDGGDLIVAGAGNDYVEGSGTVFGGTGKNTLKGSVVVGGDEGNTIYASSLAFGGAGNDYIEGYGTLFGGAGKNTLKGGGVVVGGDEGDSLAGYDNVGQYNTVEACGTVIGGTGNDTITSAAFAWGGGGDDVITGSQTVRGGAGNDTIYTTAPDKKTVIQYKVGDGDDVIYNFFDTENRVLSVMREIQLSQDYDSIDYVGNDIVIRVGSGSITLKDGVTAREASAQSQVDVLSELFPTLTGEISDDYYSVFDSNFKSAISVNTRIQDYSADSFAMTKPIAPTAPTKPSASDFLPAELLSGNISVPASTPATNSGGETSNTSTTTQETSSATPEESSTTPTQEQSSVTTTPAQEQSSTPVQTASGFSYSGGSQIISDYNGEKINYSADFTGLGLTSSDFVLNSSTGSLTIQNALDKIIDVAVNVQTIAYAFMASGGGELDGSEFSPLEVILGGNNSANTIKAGSGGSSLWGGDGGNDILYGGAGVDTFFYGKTGGSDRIYSAEEQDVINLFDITLDDISEAAVKQWGFMIYPKQGAVSTGKLEVEAQANLSPTFQLADGSRWKYNRSSDSWQNA